MRHSLISGRPIGLNDVSIIFSTAGARLAPRVDEASADEPSTKGYLSFEDALDLNLCMSFNLLDPECRERFNPFKMHFD